MSLITRTLSAALLAAALITPIASSNASERASAFETKFGYETIDGLRIAYREAGDPANPTVLLLHGFPTSSHMFRNLIPDLATDYHVIAPDFQGFGASDMPSAETYDYTFDSLAGTVEELLERKNIENYALYLMDYGAPVGYRLFADAPEKVSGFIIQNGNAYEEGLPEFWDPIRAYWADPSEENAAPLRAFLGIEGTKWQFTHGTRNPDAISPDNYWHVQYLLDRPGNAEVQLELFYDYRTNLTLYPEWQALFREHQPPALVVWGQNDQIFPAEGAHPYRQDLTNVEFHLLDTGHFALEEDGAFIAEEIRDFLEREITQ
ncbi:alpha/beta hydrolase [Labrenzia sp. R4_2]|uniref:alpha/beta fold hydrolase n=1 Tax=Labrenzia sp. R4_2 TaxID=2821107 RepID=UPI001ADD388F|nr:alpha/beta hydrolase [Labrenzia sp. R4_2]MBO9419353.1 alpha/beta hydrolase [Labrenzia sp. R4_2]